MKRQTLFIWCLAALFAGIFVGVNLDRGEIEDLGWLKLNLDLASAEDWIGEKIGFGGHNAEAPLDSTSRQLNNIASTSGEPSAVCPEGYWFNGTDRRCIRKSYEPNEEIIEGAGR